MKRLLIVVDFQNDFVDGTLGFPGAEKLDAPIAEKIKEYRESGDEIVFTQDSHAKGYLETQEGKYLPVEHCMDGTPGKEFFGQVGDLVAESDPVFEKHAFGSTRLIDFLWRRQHAAQEVDKLPFSSIELVGLVSNICVISNAVIAKTVCPEVPVFVDARCTASHDKELHEKCLDVMEGLQILITNR
ncbi:MAG: cysteine hydrolase [Eggerthellaceae bacterium]|nr:cysteine hydrolase [Eggerthellaceae bacterium]